MQRTAAPVLKEVLESVLAQQRKPDRVVNLSLNGFRIHDVDVAVAFEVVDVKGQNPVHLVDTHRSDDPGVVDVNAGDAMIKDEPPPRRKYLRRLPQQTNESLKPVHIRWGTWEVDGFGNSLLVTLTSRIGTHIDWGNTVSMKSSLKMEFFDSNWKPLIAWDPYAPPATPEPVPEPASIVITGCGLAAIPLARKIKAPRVA